MIYSGNMRLMHNYKISGRAYMKLLRHLSLLVLILLVVSCGGDGGSLSRDDTPTDPGDGLTGVTELHIEGSSGVVSRNSPMFITATLTNNEVPIENQIITFTTDIGFLSTSSAVTDENGIARLTLSAGDDIGVGIITATYDSLELPFNFAIVESRTIELTISNSEVSQSSPATITAILTDDGQPMANQIITFSSTLGVLDPEIGTARTNVDGIATIVLQAGTVAGAGTIAAVFNEQVVGGITFETSGDGDAGGGPIIADLDIFVDSPQLASSGADSVLITAIVKNGNNNLVEGVDVVFSSSSGQIEVQNSVTQADGKASAILKTLSEPENRVITVTASSGSFNDTVDVQVTGTNISINGSSALAINDANDFVIKVVDSDNNGIEGVDIALSLSGLSTTSPAGSVADITIADSVTTDFSGQAVIPVTGTSGGTNSIIASANGASTEFDVAVQADSFLFTNFDNGDGDVISPEGNTIPDVLLSDTVSISLTWLREGVVVPDGTVVNFTSTRGVLAASNATTVNGVVTAQLNSVDAGKALVTFTGIDNNIELSNQLEFEFVAESASSITAQASPKSIGPNGETSIISVIVKDINGNLVKNKDIDFTLIDVNGGEIRPAEARTDSNGSASTVYTSNTVSSKDGVSISATVRDIPSVNTVETITVADRGVSIALGTGNSLEEDTSTTYNKRYTIFVTDIDSTPIEGAELKISAIPSSFSKGSWVRIFEDGEFKIWDAIETIECPNEDLNLNGFLDHGEDTNGDGFLTPGNVVAATGQAVTDEFGRADIDIIYAQSFAQWVNINLIVSTSVSGTENIKVSKFDLPVAASDVNQEDVTPPTDSTSISSPFGSSGACDTTD